MSMTRKEATHILKIGSWWDCLPDDMSDADMNPLQDALDVALEALRPISREQVEKVWRGEWIDGVCRKCGFDAMYYKDVPVRVHTKFCPNCGAPMTDEAVDMVMERLEALYE